MSPALVVLTSCQNSYPFQERHLYLREPVKIGRTVARSRPAKNNAIFDCKVLSRDHALLWFDHRSTKFYLQDSGSSNGTFINSRRLSPPGEKSPPSQVFTGDIIQFGVDVTECNRKVTHECVVSTVCLFLPGHVEASHRSEEDPPPPLPHANVMTSPLPPDKVSDSTPGVYSLELFQLSQYLKEALQREQMLEQKLTTLQWLLGRTQKASEASFQAVADEDQLFSRIDIMENMLQALSGTQPEGGVSELLALQKDMHTYESAAKDALRKVLQEKVEVCQTLSKVELSLSSAQDGCLHLQHLREQAEQELTALANKYNMAVSLIKDLTHTIQLAETRQKEQLLKHQQEKEELQLLIQSLEAQKQEPQAHSRTKQQLASLQGCLEQFQDKFTKSNIFETLLLKRGSERNVVHQLTECQKVLENCLFSGWTAEGLGGDLPEKLKGALLSGLLRCVRDAKTVTEESELDAADCAVTDELGSGKDCTNRSTVGMEEKTENGAVTNLTLLNEDCGSGELQSREAELKLKEADLQSREAELQSKFVGLQSKEAELHSREAELCKAQDQAASTQSRCVELQDLLEKEQREARLHSQEAANQLQALEAQVQRLQEEVRMVCAERDCAVSSAQEEALLLRGALEARASERERERAALQESLSAMTAEQDRWRQRAAEYEREADGLKTRLQEVTQQSARAVQQQGELQKNCAVLQTESAALRSEKKALQDNLQRLEKELHGSRDQAALLGRSVSVLERTQGELESRLAEQQGQHQQDCARLQAQLDQAARRVRGLQREYEDTQVELVQVKQRCSEVEQEKLSLSEELQQCKDNLAHLQERTSRYEDTQVELVQVKQRCSEVEQEKLSLSEELQQCKDNLAHLQERTSRLSLQSFLPVLVGVVLAALFWGYSSLW